MSNSIKSSSNKPTSIAEVKALADAILAKDRTALSKGITLIESVREDDRLLAAHLVEHCLPHSGNAIRVGITGVPGVGKSSFIDVLGTHVCSLGYQLAVLAIDPSSEKTKGSILGDKTRMEALATEPKAFIRPSPTSGSLGGVARRTHDSILLCEAAGFDIIFVETVGVGQSETAVHSMVDFFLLLMLSGAGDELQGIKRGITELADAIVITKADGDNKASAERAAQIYQDALHLFPLAADGWKPLVQTASAQDKTGIDATWQTIQDHHQLMLENNILAAKRKTQAKFWFDTTLKDLLVDRFLKNQSEADKYLQAEKAVENGETSPLLAILRLLGMA